MTLHLRTKLGALLLNALALSACGGGGSTPSGPTPTPNRAPTANAGTASTDEDVAAGITLTGEDIDGDRLTYSVVASPANGTLSCTASS